MNILINVAKEKLDQLQFPINEKSPILPQLMLAVFNEETPYELNLNMGDRASMEQQIFELMDYSDDEVIIWLNLQEEESQEQFADLLKQSKSEEEIREVLILEILFEAMRENYDEFPSRITPLI
jgi:hypothetical protein